MFTLSTVLDRGQQAAYFMFCRYLVFTEKKKTPTLLLVPAFLQFNYTSIQSIILNKTHSCVNSGFQYRLSGVFFGGLPYCDFDCCHAMSLWLVMNNSNCLYFCLLSVMNVVMVQENNPNNILPYKE